MTRTYRLNRHAGTTAVHVVALAQVTPVAGIPAKRKVVFPATMLKSVPVIVMVEPVVPLLGIIKVSVGKTAKLNTFLDSAGDAVDSDRQVNGCVHTA